MQKFGQRKYAWPFVLFYSNGRPSRLFRYVVDTVVHCPDPSSMKDSLPPCGMLSADSLQMSNHSGTASVAQKHLSLTPFRFSQHLITNSVPFNTTVQILVHVQCKTVNVGPTWENSEWTFYIQSCLWSDRSGCWACIIAQLFCLTNPSCSDIDSMNIP